MSLEDEAAESLTRRPLLQSSASFNSYDSNGETVATAINNNDYHDQDITRIIPFFEQDNKQLVTPLVNKLSNLNELEELNSPKDRYFGVYIVFLMFGIANLLPWNIFITATDYFVSYKLNTTSSQNASYPQNFVFAVGTLGQLTGLIMNLMNMLIVFGGNPKNRIPFTFILCSAVILFHVIMATVDSSDWPLTFFILCLISVFIMNVATGIMNSCIFYLVSIFPMQYVNAIIVGSNLSGVFTTVMSLISKASTPNLKLAAIFYFLSAFVALVLGLAGYYLMHKTAFYKHWNQISEMRNAKNLLKSDEINHRVPYWDIIKKIWLMLFCIWLNFLSTLAIFPVFQQGIERSSSNFFIPDKWFQDFVTFLTFNLLVTIGNMLPQLFKWPGPKWIALPVFLRALCVFIFFSMCNFKPKEKHRIPVLIHNDWVYWLGSALSPLLYGYLTSLLMMYTPKLVKPEHAGTASQLSALALSIGVVSGLQFEKALEHIVLA